MTIRARPIVTLALFISLSTAASGALERTLAVVDNKPIDSGPGDVAVVPNRTDLVITMGFNRNEAITHRTEPDGRLSELARSPVGPEPRAMTFAFNGDLLILCNSIANELGVFEVGEDGRLREINRASSGGLNPYDVTSVDDLVMVANRDSNTVNSFRIDRRGRLTPVDSEPGGLAPHVLAVSQGGTLAVGNQTDRSLSWYRVSPQGELTPRGTTPLDNMTPRTMAWRNNNWLYAALDAPAPAEDLIRAFEVRDNGEVAHRGDTPGGAFLTDLEATPNALVAVTVNVNGPGGADDRDELRAYRFQGNELVLDRSVQTPGAPPSFKQVAAGGLLPGVRHVLTSEFQGGWVRSFFYFNGDEEP